MFKKVYKNFSRLAEEKSTQLLMFYAIVGIELLAMLFIMMFQIMMEYDTKSIVPLFVSIIYLLFVFFFATKYPKRIMLFKVLTLLPMLYLVIPYLYMGTEGGGIKSGMPIWMVLGLLMIFLFTKGIYFYVLFPVTMVVYIGCIIYSYMFLQDSLGQLEELYYYQDNILAIVAVSLSCGMVFKYQQRYEERSKQKIEQEKLKAQKANDAKSQFLANMSHDIRTPMNAILGMTEMANYHIDDKEKVQECLKKINDSSVMLLHLINNVLDMSEIESHELKLKEIKFNLCEVVTELYTVLEQNAISKGLDLGVHCDEIRDDRLVGDVVRLRQVLMNLLSNSIKFTPEGGSVSLLVRQLEKTKETVAAPEGYVSFLLQVKDNGIGMKKEFIDTMIFKPFERDETQYVNKTEGSGIGMSITKTILDVMGADLQIESEPGKGTTFTITLCMKKDEESQQEEHEESNKVPNAEGKRLLVVEDNEINMEIILAILERTKAEVINAWNAEDAIKIFSEVEEGFFDLVLMDIQLPGMNGYEAAKVIRSKDSIIPIFAMTANAFAQDVEESKRSGMNEHISKPIDIEELYQKMQQYLL